MRYLLLLKGINVGGHHTVKMDALKSLLTELNLKKPKTYIQSGNAIFESCLSKRVLSELISEGFDQKFGFLPSLQILDRTEIQTVVSQLPFSTEEQSAADLADPSVEHLYVIFLSGPPEPEQLATLVSQNTETDCIRPGQNVLYLLSHQSIRKSKAAIKTGKNFPDATIRNWNTVSKLNDMLKE